MGDESYLPDRFAFGPGLAATNKPMVMMNDCSVDMHAEARHIIAGTSLLLGEACDLAPRQLGTTHLHAEHLDILLSFGKRLASALVIDKSQCAEHQLSCNPVRVTALLSLPYALFNLQGDLHALASKTCHWQ